MTSSLIAQHKAKHLLSHVLAAATARRWPQAILGETGETPTGFYADVALAEAPGDEDLSALTDDMVRVLRDTRAFRSLSLDRRAALAAFDGQPWKLHQVEALSEIRPQIECYEIDGFYDICDCRLKTTKDLLAVHPEGFVLTGASLVAWWHRGKERWFNRIVGELFPAPTPCSCCG